MKRIVAVLTVFVMFCVSSSASTLYENTLDNGLRYRIYSAGTLPIISVNIKVKAGSYFDKKFGEAAVLASSMDSCSTKDLASEQFRDMVDAAGGRIGVLASKEYIDISAKFPLSQYDRMFYLLSEMFRSRFDKKNFNFVKKNAVNRVESLKSDNDYLSLHAAFAGLIRQPEYYHTSLGRVKSIRSISVNDISVFFKNYFTTENMVISISGGQLKKDKIEHAIKRYFSFLKRGKSYDFEPLAFKKGLFVKDIIKPVKQSYIYLAFPSFSGTDRRYYAAKILSFIMGGNLSSVLAQDIRTKHGYSYSVFAFNYELNRGGVFVIGLQTQNRFTLDAVRRIFEDIKNIDGFITPKRIEDAKRYLIGKNEIALQNSSSMADSLSLAYMLNISKLPWVHFRKNIDAVKPDDVTGAAKYIFSNVSIGIVSNKNYKDDISKIAKEYGY